MKQVDLRNIKRIRLLEKIYREESATRSGIASEMRLNPTSTIRLVAELRDLGLVKSRPEPEVDRPGRPTDILTIEPTCGYAVGIELGRGVMTAVVTDAIGQIIHVEDISDPPPFVADAATLRGVMDAMKRVTATAGIAWRSVGSVGLALHDVVTSQGEWTVWGQITASPFPAKRHLEEDLKRVAAVEDVSRAFAKAEHQFGDGRGSPDMLYVFIGKRNVGAGVFVNDAMLRSASGICGEIGHIIVEESGALCQCGNRGCFEAVSSGDAVTERYLGLLESGVPSTLARQDVDFGAICTAARSGEKAAQLVVHDLATNLGRALASSISVTGATAVLIGGKVRNAGPDFTSDVAITLRQRVIPALAPLIDVRFASIGEHGGAWGAALLALDEAWRLGRFYAMANQTA